MSTSIKYYFNSPEKLPFPELLDGVTETYELLAAVKPFLNRLLVDPNVRECLGEIRGNSPNFHGNCFIGEGTVVYNDVTIIGPVYIGKNCELMPGAIIRPNTIIGDGCSIGHGSEVKRSVLFGGSKVASLAFVGDCILGASARIGSGVITANRKFNQSNAAITLDSQRIDLGDSYFGCILGDSARLGANCVTQPGTHIGPYTWIYPLTNIRGFIPEGKRVYHPKELVFEENERLELKP